MELFGFAEQVEGQLGIGRDMIEEGAETCQVFGCSG